MQVARDHISQATVGPEETKRIEGLRDASDAVLETIRQCAGSGSP